MRHWFVFAVGALGFLAPGVTAAPALAQNPPALPPLSGQAASGNAVARGLEAYRKGDMETARTLLSQAVPADSSNGEAHAILGYLLVRAGDAAGAVPHLEKAVALRPNDADGYTNLGNALLQRTPRTAADTTRAIEMLEKAAQLLPESADAQMTLGYALARGGRFDRAAAAYRRATTLGAKDGRAWTSLGLALRKMGRNEEATEALQKGTSLAPQDATAWIALGEMQYERADMAGAINSLETARKLDANSFPAAVTLAKAYSAAARYEEAGAAFGAAGEIAAAQNKPDPLLYYNQGVSLGRANKLTEASAAYDKVLALNPRLFNALLNSGFILYKQNRMDEAANRFRQAAEVKPNQSLVWKNLAATEVRRKKWPEAIDAWKKVAQLEPKNTDARESLAIALENAGRLDEAIALQKQLAVLQPDATDPYISMGLIYQKQAEAEATPAGKQARLTAALQVFQTALKRDPKSAVLYNNLGVVHEKRGELPQALAAYKKALSLDPKFTDARLNLERFKPSGLINK